MTGETLLQRTLTLLGYTDHTGEVDTAQVGEIYRGAVHMINLLLADILPMEGKEITEIEALGDDLPCHVSTAVGVLPYGLGMLVAQSEGDGTAQQLMAVTYNQKRRGIETVRETVKDALETPAE